MKISDYLKEEFCIMGLAAQDKEGAIREIAAKLNATGRISQQEEFIKAVCEREELGSTGIGHNVAIPHARTEAVKGFVIGAGRSWEGIDFDALDGQKVKFIFLMGADPKELNLYLRLLAELSKLLMNDSFRRDLFSAKEAGEVIEIIKKFEKKG